MIFGSSIIGGNTRTVVGPTGYTGPAGFIGATGPTGTVLGPTGATGVYITDVSTNLDNNTIRFTLSDGTSNIQLFGFTGPTGYYSNSDGKTAVGTDYKNLFYRVDGGKTFEFRGICGGGNITATATGGYEIALTVNDFSGSVLYGQSAPNYVIYTTETNAAVSSKIGITGTNSILSFGITAHGGATGNYVKVYSDFTDKLYVMSSAFGRNTSSYNTDDVITDYTAGEGVVVNLKKHSSYKLPTPVGIKQFITDTDTTELQSYTLFVQGSDVWNFPENVYFENSAKGISSYGFLEGMNILNMWTANGGVTFNASFVDRGIGESETNYFAASIGSCCYTDGSGNRQCQEYTNPSACKDLGGVFTPLRRCIETCGVFGSCCIDCTCYDNVSQTICQKFNGVFSADTCTQRGECCPDTDSVYDFNFYTQVNDNNEIIPITETVLQANQDGSYLTQIKLQLTATNGGVFTPADASLSWNSNGQFVYLDKYTVSLKQQNPGDLDGSGAVDAGDIGSLLILFNQDVQAGSPGDLDGSGAVDAGDIGSLLILFGDAQPYNGVLETPTNGRIAILEIRLPANLDRFGREIGKEYYLDFSIKDNNGISKVTKRLTFYVGEKPSPKTIGCLSCDGNQGRDRTKLKLQTKFIASRRCLDCAQYENSIITPYPLKQQIGYVNMCVTTNPAAITCSATGVAIDIDCVSFGEQFVVNDCKNSIYANDNEVHLEYNSPSGQRGIDMGGVVSGDGYWQGNRRSCTNPTIQNQYKGIYFGCSDGFATPTCKGQVKTCANNSSITMDPYYNTIEYPTLIPDLIERGVITPDQNGIINDSDRTKLQQIFNKLDQTISGITQNFGLVYPRLFGKKISGSQTFFTYVNEPAGIILNPSLLKCCAGEEIFGDLRQTSVFDLGWQEPDDSTTNPKYEVKYLLFLVNKGTSQRYELDITCGAEEGVTDLVCRGFDNITAEKCGTELTLNIVRVVLDKAKLQQNKIQIIKDRSCSGRFFDGNNINLGFKSSILFENTITEKIGCACSVSGARLISTNNCPNWGISLLGEIKESDLSKLSNGKYSLQYEQKSFNTRKDSTVPACHNTKSVWPVRWDDKANIWSRKPVYTEIDDNLKFDLSQKFKTGIYPDVECDASAESARDVRCTAPLTCILSPDYANNPCYCDGRWDGQGPLQSANGYLTLDLLQQQADNEIKFRGKWWNCASGTCVLDTVPAGYVVFANYGNGKYENFTQYMTTPAGDPASGLRGISFAYDNIAYSYAKYTKDDYDGTLTYSPCNPNASEKYSLFPSLIMYSPISSSSSTNDTGTLLGGGPGFGVPAAYVEKSIKTAPSGQEYEELTPCKVRVFPYISKYYESGTNTTGYDITVNAAVNIWTIINNPEYINNRPDNPVLKLKTITPEEVKIDCILYNNSSTNNGEPIVQPMNWTGGPEALQTVFTNVPLSYAIDQTDGKFLLMLVVSLKSNDGDLLRTQNYLDNDDNVLQTCDSNKRSRTLVTQFYVKDPAKNIRVLKLSQSSTIKNKNIDGICVSLECGDSASSYCNSLEDC